jgi:hypothetical protein
MAFIPNTALTGTMLAALFLSISAVAGTTPQDSSAAANIPSARTTITKSGTMQMVFEEQKIEGKIRRPQLVLIKADQRPDFTPMVMQSMGKTKNIASLADQGLIDNMPFEGAFKFEGTKIINIVP